MVCIDLPEISFCNVNPLRLSLGPRQFCSPSSIQNHMDGRAPANLGPSLNHLAIGHSNCTAATCCFMPFRNPFLPSTDQTSERAAHSMRSVFSLRSRYPRSHSFIRSTIELRRGAEICAVCRIIIRPLLYWNLLPLTHFPLAIVLSAPVGECALACDCSLRTCGLGSINELASL